MSASAILDASPKSGYPGTVTGATVKDGRIGQPAIDFDGNDKIECARLPFDAALGFTLALWMFTTNTSQSAHLLGSYDENTKRQVTLHLYGGSLRFNTTPDGTWYAGNLATITPVSGWSFVAATYGASQNIVYVNNSKSAITRSNNGIEATNIPFYIGYSPKIFGANNVYFTGRMSRLRVFNRALNEQEIHDLYHEFLAYWI